MASSFVRMKYLGMRRLANLGYLALFNLVTFTAFAEDQINRPFGVDMSIESMSSKEFSVGIFFFLILAILIFVGITVMYMFKGKGSQLKTGEKWMFAWIFFGIVLAIIFGAAQMMHGYLF